MDKNTSIDTFELNKFKKTSKEWWDKKGEFSILHKINPIRIEYITKKIKKHFSISKESEIPLSKLNLIDIGCGGGLVCVPMSKLGVNVTGLDINESNIIAASEYAKHTDFKINYIKQTIEEHRISQNKYDIILCLEVIEHVANPNIFVKNLVKLLKPGGMIIISTINRTIKSYLLAIVMAEYVLRWIPQNTHHYSKLIKPSEIKHMLNPYKMRLKELKGLSYDLSSQNWQLSDNIDVNYFAYII